MSVKKLVVCDRWVPRYSPHSPEVQTGYKPCAGDIQKRNGKSVCSKCGHVYE